MPTIEVRRVYTMTLDLGEMYCIERAVERYRDYLHENGAEGPLFGRGTSVELAAALKSALKEDHDA